VDCKINPLKDVGPIEFGMLPNRVRKIIGLEFTSFKRAPQSNFPCDYFQAMGMFAYYKISGELEALEFSLPSEPTLDGFKFLKMDFGAATDFLKTKDAMLKKEEDGVIAYSIGVSLYAPKAKKVLKEPCESVFVFDFGYYD
jgi:hypothetical protein